MTIRIVTPRSPDYNPARAVVNMACEGMPDALLFCEDAEDVSKAVTMAVNDGKSVRVRSGRHSYAGFSSGSKGVYVIDVSPINQVSVASDRTSATIGAGGQLYDDVYLPLWQQARVTIPAGSCPTVGMGGLAAGGGFSFSGRHMGLTCDSIKAMTIVTADGHIRKIGENITGDTDLFWACCGAGCGNFGVIADFTVKVWPADDVAIFQLHFKWDGQVAKVSNAWADMISNTSPALMAFLRFARLEDSLTLRVFGQYYGPESSLKSLIDAHFSGCEIISGAFMTLSNIDAIAYWAGRRHDADTTGMPAHDPHQYAHLRAGNPGDAPFPQSTFAASSVMLDRFFNADELACIENTFCKRPVNSAFLVLDSHINGVSAKLPADWNAYAHRQSVASAQIYSTWTQEQHEQDSVAWVRALRNALAAAGHQGAYCNYPDILIKDSASAYYGQHVEKLKAIKARYDPNSLFTYEQAIAPAAHSPTREQSPSV